MQKGINMGYEIKLADKDNIKTITELLNKVTFHLHSKGIMQWIYPWNINDIELDVNKKHTYIVKINNLTIGTFSLKNLDMNWLSAAKQDSLYFIE